MSELDKLFYTLKLADETGPTINDVKSRISELQTQLNLTIDTSKVTEAFNKMIDAANQINTAASNLGNLNINFGGGASSNQVEQNIKNTTTAAEQCQEKIDSLQNYIDRLYTTKAATGGVPGLNPATMDSVIQKARDLKIAYEQIKNSGGSNQEMLEAMNRLNPKIDSEVAKFYKLGDVINAVGKEIDSLQAKLNLKAATGSNTGDMAARITELQAFKDALVALNNTGARGVTDAATLKGITAQFDALKNSVTKTMDEIKRADAVESIVQNAKNKVTELTIVLEKMDVLIAKAKAFNIDTTGLENARKKVQDIINDLNSGDTAKQNKALGSGISTVLKEASYETQKLKASVNDTEKSAKKLGQTFDSSKNSITRVNQEADKTHKLIQKAADASNDMASGIGQFAMQFTAGALTVQALNKMVEGLENAVNTIFDFEKANSKLAAILGKNRQEISDLTIAAEDLGRTTTFTATQVTELQTELAKLGFNKQQILDAEQAVLNFAKATGTTLAEAAKTAGSTVRMFGAEASETERYVSAMAIATTKSALDFSAISQNLATFGPVAAAMGFTIEDVLALFGQLRNAGFQGTIAMTALRNIFTQIADEGSKLSRALGRPITTLEDLQEGLRNMEASGVDVAEAMGMAGKRGGAQLIALISQADSLIELRDSIREGESSFEDMAYTMDNNVKGSMIRLESAWQGLILSFQESDGAIQGLVDGMTKLVNGFNKVITGGEGDFGSEAMERATKALIGLVTAYGLYKGIKGVQSLATAASWKAEELALEKLILSKQKNIMTDVEIAEMNGVITKSQAERIMSLRALVTAQGQAAAANATEAASATGDAAANAADATAKGVNTAATTTLQKAQALLNASFLKSPLFGMAAVITGVSYAVYKLATAEDMETVARRNSNNEMREFNNLLADRKNKLNELISTIQDETKTELSRARALDELKTLYPNAYAGKSVADITAMKDDAVKSGLSAEDLFESDKLKKDLNDITSIVKKFSDSVQYGFGTARGAILNLTGSAGKMARAFDEENFSFWTMFITDSTDYLDALNIKLDATETAYNKLLLAKNKATAESAGGEQQAKIINYQAEYDAIQKVQAELAKVLDNTGKINTSSLDSSIQAVEKKIAELREKAGKDGVSMKVISDLESYKKVLAVLESTKAEWKRSRKTDVPVEFQTEQNNLDAAAKALLDSLSKNGFKVENGKIVIDLEFKGNNIVGDAVVIKDELAKLMPKIKEAEKKIANALSSGTVKERKDAQSELDELTRQYEALTGKKYGSNSSGGGTKKDPFAEQMKERIRVIKEGYSEYQKLLKIMSKDEALKRVGDSHLFDNIFGETNLDNVNDYLSALESLREKISNKNKGGIYNSLLLDVDKEIFTIKVGIDKDSFDRDLREIQDKLSRDAKRYDLFSTIFKATGDAAYAEEMTKNIPQIFDAVASKWNEELQKKFYESGDKRSLIDFTKTDEEAKKFFGSDNSPLYVYWKQIKDRIESNGIDFAKQGATAMQSAMSTMDKIQAKQNEKKKFESDHSAEANTDAYTAQLNAFDMEIAKLQSSMWDLEPAFKALFSDTTEMGVNQLQNIYNKAKAILDLVAQGEVVTMGDEQYYKYTDNDGKTQFMSVKKWQETSKQASKIGKKLPQVAISAKNVWKWLSGEKNADGTKKNLKDVYTDIIDVGQAAVQAASMIGDMFDSLGNEGTANMIGDITDVASGILSGAQAGAAFGPWGAAAGAVVGAVGSIAQVHDKKLDRAINKSKLEVQKLQNAYTNLSSTIERQLGSATTSQAKQMVSNLEEQSKELQKQYKAESDKKKSDKSALEDYKQQITELDEQIKYFYEDLASEQFGVDIKSWANDISSAIVDAFAAGEDAAQAFDDSVADIMKNVVKNIISLEVIQPAMQKLREFMFGTNGIFTANSAGGTDVTEQEAIDLATELQDLKGKVETSKKVFDTINDGLSGIMTSTTNDSKMTNSIKSVSESTAELLASYINAVRGNTAMIEMYEMELAKTLIPQSNAIQQSQLNALEQIVSYTKISADNTTDIKNYFKNVINGVSQISVK